MPSVVDITVLLVAAVIVLLSFRSGFFRCLLDIVALVFAVFLAHFLYDKLIVSFPILSKNPLAYVIFIFVVFLVGFGFLEIFLSVLIKFVKIEIFSAVDKVAAILLGVFKVLIIGGLIFRLLALAPLPASTKAEIDTSYARKWFGPSFDFCYAQAKQVTGVKGYKVIESPAPQTQSEKTSLDQLQKSLPKDVKLKELDLPRLRLELEKALERDGQ